MKTSIFAMFVVIAASLFTSVAAAQSDARVFAVYARDNNGSTKQGTGFLVGPNTIATAYHVVEGARKIEAIDGSTGRRSFSVVSVVGVSTTRDLAILRLNKSSPAAAFAMSTTAPSLNELFSVVGYSLGINQHSLRTYSTAPSGFLRSNSLRDLNSRQIFREIFDLISLDLTAYSGISGAPLIGANGTVRGVVVASLDQGSGFAWAIPASDLIALMSKNNSPETITTYNWLPLTTMANNTRYALRNFNANSGLESSLDRLPSLMDKLKAANQVILQASLSLSSGSYIGKCTSVDGAVRTAQTTSIYIDPQYRQSPLEVANSALRPSLTNEFDVGSAKKLQNALQTRSTTLGSIRTLVSEFATNIRELPSDSRERVSFERSARRIAIQDIDIERSSIESLNGISIADLQLWVSDQLSISSFSNEVEVDDFLKDCSHSISSLRTYYTTGFEEETRAIERWEGLLQFHRASAVYTEAR